jgi:hypothetical protein
MRNHVRSFLNKLRWRKLSRMVQSEAIGVLALLCYLCSSFAVLYPHLLAANALFIGAFLVIWHQVEYLWRIWHAAPTDPRPPFRWRILASTLLFALSPVLLLMLLLWRARYPW